MCVCVHARIHVHLFLSDRERIRNLDQVFSHPKETALFSKCMLDLRLQEELSKYKPM